jgi:hypothetical protein
MLCSRHQAQQVTISASKPAFIGNCGHINSNKVVAESRRHALIEQYPHLRRRNPLVEQILGNLKRGYCLIPPNAWEIVQELVEWVASLQVLEQGLHRNSGSGEYKRPTHDFAIPVKWKCRIRQLESP